MALLIPGVIFSALALAMLVYVLTAAPVDRIPLERRQWGKKEEKPVLSLTSDYLVSMVDRVLRGSSWAPFRERELDLAGLSMTPGALVVTVGSIGVAALVVGFVLTANVLVAILAGALVPVVAKLVLKVKIDQRRKAFAKQLDETIQMIASSLRAGHSFIRALDAVATEADSPTAEEFARVINENRIGRDLIVALEQTADRMASDDFRWVAEAVAVHRDAGGNLNEVLDRVGQTMRERNQIRQEVDTLAAEGKFSGIVLMALPAVVAGAFSLVNPGYMDPMFTSSLGKMLLAASVVLYIVGGVWMRAIVNVKF